MKTIFAFSLSILVLGSIPTYGRDLLYKFSLGYQQMSLGVKDKTTKAKRDAQLNGLNVTFGIARDMQVGGYFGFTGGFDQAAVGPTFRYDFHRLFSRDAAAWEHLNIFAQVAFLAKLGRQQEKGIALHLPYLGFEILPFSRVHFAILTGAGLVFNMVDDTRLGFTNGMFGDVGVRYYF